MTQVDRLIVDAKGTERVIYPVEQTKFEWKKEHVVDEEAILRHLMEGRRLAKEMEVGQREATVVVEAQYPDLPIFVWLNTDDHLGSIQTDYDAFLRDYGIVRDTPNFFAVSNGDEIDNFMVNHGSLSTGVYEDVITPEQQALLMRRLFGKLDGAKKMLAMSFGNHNQWVRGMGYKFENTWLREMRCAILNCGGQITIKYGEQEYRIAMTHRFWGNSKLNPTNAAKRYMDYSGFPNADVYFLGHTHVSEVLHFRRGSDYRLAIIGGTYKVDDEWAAESGIAGSRGQEAGICLALSPHNKRIEVFTNMTRAKEIFEMYRDIARLKPMEDAFA